MGAAGDCLGTSARSSCVAAKAGVGFRRHLERPVLKQNPSKTVVDTAAAVFIDHRDLRPATEFWGMFHLKR